MSSDSTFEVNLDGETVSLPLSRARELCPAEVVAMEAAGRKVREAARLNDTQAMTAASEELEQRMRALLHALAEQEALRQGQ